MRFVTKLICFSAFAAILPATTLAQVYPRASEEQTAVPRDPSDLRRRAAGSSETPFVVKGLYTERIATGLGHVSAMISLEDGSIYALNKTSGQLLHLTDRGLDARIDTQQPLTDGFDTPTGLTFANGQLYVSDLQAIWRVDIDTGAKSRFVNLRNITAGEHRPIFAYENRILLGVNRSESLSQVMSVDGATGQATHLTDVPEAPIRALSFGGGRLWAAVGKSLRPVDTQSNTDFAKHYPLESGAAAVSLILPSTETAWPEGWPVSMRDYILAVQGPASERPSNRSSGGNNIIALPTQFGAPRKDISVLVGGFMSRDGQSAWAAPTAILMDSRGLFFADRIGGSLWRVGVDNRPAPKPRQRISEPLPPLPVQKPSLKPNETPPMEGSLIGEGSSLGTASTLEVGSYLKKEHDDKEAAKLAAEKAAEDAKTKSKR